MGIRCPQEIVNNNRIKQNTRALTRSLVRPDPCCPVLSRPAPPRVAPYRPGRPVPSICLFCLYRISAPLVALIELGVSKLVGKLPSLVCSTPKGRVFNLLFTDFEVFVHALIAPPRVVSFRPVPPRLAQSLSDPSRPCSVPSCRAVAILAQVLLRTVQLDLACKA